MSDLTERELWKTTAAEQRRQADLEMQLKAMEVRLEALTWVRNEIIALCEDTEARYAATATETEGKPGAYARGRIAEAKSIRNAMGEVIRERIAACELEDDVRGDANEQGR